MRFFTTVLCLLYCSLSFSQDILQKRDGEEFKVKVTEITATEVKYKRFDNPDGPLYTLLKTEISVLTYANGTHEDLGAAKPDTFFVTQPVKPVIIAPEDKSATTVSYEQFTRGDADARMHYHNYKGAGTGTLIVGLLSPLVGLIPAIACSATPPSDANLGYPSVEQFNQANYQNGYRQRARKIKSGKVWTNWGIALGVNLVAVLALSAR